MAEPVLSMSAGSSFGPLANAANTYRICSGLTQISRVHVIADVTQIGDTDTGYDPDPAVIITAARYAASKRYIMRVSGWGFYQRSVDAGTTWSDVHAFTVAGGAAIVGAVQGRVSKAVIQRTMQLENVTAANDALPKTLFSYQKLSYSGSLRGFLQSIETPLDNDVNAAPLTTLTLPFDTGSISGKAIYDDLDESLRFNEGGANPLVTRFRFSGPTTRVLCPFSILKFPTVVTDLDNGQTLTATFWAETLRADVDYDTAGVIPFAYSGVLSDFVFA